MRPSMYVRKRKVPYQDAFSQWDKASQVQSSEVRVSSLNVVPVLVIQYRSKAGGLVAIPAF